MPPVKVAIRISEGQVAIPAPPRVRQQAEGTANDKGWSSR